MRVGRTWDIWGTLGLCLWVAFFHVEDMSIQPPEQFCGPLFLLLQEAADGAVCRRHRATLLETQNHKTGSIKQDLHHTAVVMSRSRPHWDRKGILYLKCWKHRFLQSAGLSICCRVRDGAPEPSRRGGGGGRWQTAGVLGGRGHGVPLMEKSLNCSFRRTRQRWPVPVPVMSDAAGDTAEGDTCWGHADHVCAWCPTCPGPAPVGCSRLHCAPPTGCGFPGIKHSVWLTESRSANGCSVISVMDEALTWARQTTTQTSCYLRLF